MKTKLNGFLTLLLALLVQVTFAQEKTVTGTVSDESGPLPGVTVLIQGTKSGTQTDFDGKYSLKANVGNVLIFSFVGMDNQTRTVGASNVINVVMSGAQLLEEVVVTALGISKEKKALGYAVQQVSAKEISRANNPNLLTNMSGKMAGVEVRQSSGMPGAPATVLIRGARSFDGNNQPLYVVDGMPISSGSDYAQNVTGTFSSSRTMDIDPSDIESINVLKGQAAAALYGLRASNGVIIITTKSGKSTAKGNPTVNFTTSYTMDLVATLPEVQQTYAQGSGATGVNATTGGSFAPANSLSWGPKISDLPTIATYGGDSQGQAGQFWDPYKAAWVTPKAYNNAENFFETGSTQYYGLNISNSNEFANYLIGLSATDQEAIMLSSGMTRYTAKLSSTFNMGEKWKSGFSANYSDVKINKLPSGNDSNLFTVYGAPASFDLMGTPFNMEGPLGEYRQISYRRGSVGENPRWAAKNNQFLETTRRFFGNTFVEYKPADWVNVRYQLGIDSYSTDNEDIYQMGSAATGQALPTAADYTTPTKTTFGYRAPTGGRINNYGVMRSNLNSLLNVTFTKDFSEDLKASLLVGNEIRDERSRSWTMQGSGFTIPGWNNMSNTTTQTADEGKSKFRSAGTYANLSLDFMNMLYFNATGRYDIVSTMPRDNRSFFYPSVSLGFIFTEVGGLKDNDILSFGKIRTSYAQVGQAGSYREPIYYAGGAGSGFLSDGITYPLGGVSGFRPNETIYDPALKPQNTKNFEVGADLKFLKNRIGLDYTYSKQTATDQIFSVPMAGSTGYAQFVTNAGEMTTEAHEIMAYFIPVQTNDFEWNINANFTKIENKVISLANGIESVSLAGFTTPNVRAYAGYTYPTIYGETLLRNDKGEVIINNNPASPDYGFPQAGGAGKIGDVSPDFILGVTNSFTYKFVSLTAQMDWKSGGQIYSGTNRLMGLYGSSKFTENRTDTFQYGDTENAHENGVLPDGTPNNITRGGATDLGAYQHFYSNVYGAISEMNIYDSSYLKLREVALSFTLPKSLLEKAKVKAASISLIGRNFLLWSNLPNVDPETSQGTGNGVGGFDYVSLPQTTAYGVTLNLTF